MTTQPQFRDTDGATGDGDQHPVDPQRADMAADPHGQPTQPAERDENSGARTTEPPMAPREEVPPVEQPRATEPRQSSPQSSTEVLLFASDDLTALRARWDDVQAGFVDDPRKCVQTADGLVSDVVHQLADGFSHARSKLEEQWARGEDVSTEDLRQALKRYREFFDRLLAV
jgi:hypothetical protein